MPEDTDVVVDQQRETPEGVTRQLCEVREDYGQDPNGAQGILRGRVVVVVAGSVRLR